MHRPAKVLIAAVLLLAQFSFASAPVVEGPLPVLNIEKPGELILAGDKISHQPWSSEAPVGKVHLVQYVAGTRSGSEIFEPVTDTLLQTYEKGSYHVTTILNLDDATWGTSRLVSSEAGKSKRKYPDSTIVLDKNGDGKELWQLGKKGAGMMILDAQGTVLYFARAALSESEVKKVVELVGSYIK